MWFLFIYLFLAASGLGCSTQDLPCATGSVVAELGLSWNRTCVPCIARWILNHQATREVLLLCVGRRATRLTHTPIQVRVGAMGRMTAQLLVAIYLSFPSSVTSVPPHLALWLLPLEYPVGCCVLSDTRVIKMPSLMSVFLPAIKCRVTGWLRTGSG